MGFKLDTGFEMNEETRVRDEVGVLGRDLVRVGFGVETGSGESLVDTRVLR